MNESPSTLMFVLRHHAVGFIGGLFLIAVGLNHFLNPPEPSPGDFVSLVETVAPFAYGCAAIIGVFVAMSSWRRARKLRLGFG